MTKAKINMASPSYLLSMKTSSKSGIYHFCFVYKCGANTSFDLCADMAKVKQTRHLLHICYPRKHRVNAVLTIFAL